MMSRLHHASFFFTRTEQLSKTSLILFTVLAVTLAACSEDTAVIDSASPDVPLSFKDLQLGAYVFDTDSISIRPGTDKKPEDPVTLAFRVSVSVARDARDTERTVQSVRCRVVTDAGSDEKFSDALQGGNDLYTASVAVPIRRGDVGDYRVIIDGTDSRGKPINPIFTKINVLFGNNPPAFCGITAPDTLDLPASGFIVVHIEACVTDPSGPGDIKRVFFNSFLPNGLPSIDNPFLTYDDGTHGDRVAGDGQYSLDVQLPSTAQKGTYRFEFFAIDLSKLQSKVVIHTLYVR
jgi:hypothetical protein